MKRLLIMAIYCVFTASLVLADGDGPMRPMNTAESAAFNTLQKTIRAALPTAPADYSSDYAGFDRKEVSEVITPDRMASMSFKTLYTLNPEVKAARQQAALMNQIKGTPEQQARQSALAARSTELKAARKGTRDPAEKEKIRAELKKINAEENALTNEIAAGIRSGAATDANQSIDKTLPPKEFSIGVFVNQDVHVYDIAKPIPVNGAPMAFEQDDQCQDSGTYCITVLLGTFDKEKRISGSTRYNLRNANLGVPTKARGMALVVTGAKDRKDSVKAFMAKIDLEKLKSLLP
ncbi:MAG: hypothetical protein ABIL58_10745 [Pseudomonadota bacterium]